MPYPKPPQSDGIDAQRYAFEIDNEINALVRSSDALILGPTFPLQTYLALIHHARITKERLAQFQKGGDYERIVVALVDLFRVRDAASKPDVDAINAGLKEIVGAIDTFIPAAVADFPTDANGNIAWQRFNADGSIANIVLVTKPPASLAIVEALRSAVEA